MGLNAKLAWIALFFCLGLITLAHSVPVKVVYTGEGCECPSKLGYSVNVPSVPKPKKYVHNEYGYKVEVPTLDQEKAKVTYNFDFSVEEPLPSQPVRPSKLNLFATVDRVAVKRGDCEYNYNAPSSPSACRCGQCGIAKPLNRYVFDNVTPSTPCNCGRPKCQCNRCRSASTPYSPNAIFMGPSVSDITPETSSVSDRDNGYLQSDGDGAGSGAVNVHRRKRDLPRTLFRPRKFARERPGRLLRLYTKNLSETPHRVFDSESVANKNQRQHQHHQQAPKKAKRKAKKTQYAHKRSRLVKRDIKGEYDLLEEEREQMDLTLPEIIQFMPETLQPNFKRGQSYIGCGSQRSSQLKDEDSNNETESSSASTTEYSNNSKESNTNNTDTSMTHTDPNTKDMKMDVTTDEHTHRVTDNTQYSENEKAKISKQSVLIKETKSTSAENSIGSAYTKRNAANCDYGRSSASPESACPKCQTCLPALLTKKAYNAHLPAAPLISTNPIYESQQPTYPEIAPSAAAPTNKAAAKVPESHNFYNNLGHKFLESKGQLRYASDLDSPAVAHSSYPQGVPPSVASHSYPVQHISNANIDRIIADIVYRHPAFLDVSSHYGGALVDPEPRQEEDTKAFLKKLIDGGLNLWFGQENEYNPLKFNPPYSASPHNFDTTQLHDLLPSLY